MTTLLIPLTDFQGVFLYVFTRKPIFFCHQMLITSSQMQWTADVTKALAVTKERGDKKALKSMKKKQVSLIMNIVSSNNS